MFKINHNDKDHKSVALFFLEWEKYVQNQNFSSAKKLFDHNVVSFGTWMDVVQGLDNLEERQWKKIWPNISNFSFLTETLFIQLSPDKLFANCILIWNSNGYDKLGKEFKRPGRATITLIRNNLRKPWKAIHSHLSLNKSVPQKSYGKKS